ncbi:MAG: 50S ribosomal protein L18a [Candidatus Thermoplasmatota archaeon]|nr:50S ribosomal protein L18a [Candidatus Thermoplasmatota archaeon]MBS3790522.1 50S ribosomal protein L18a [Candidatus Thermoplasmatota archaeon]
MKVHKVMGKFRMSKEKGEWQRFSKEVISEDEEEAIEKIYSILGSKHRVKRTNVKIYDTEEVDEDEVENNLIQEKIEAEE